METVKKARRTHRKGVVSVLAANGRPVSPEVKARRRAEDAWDVQWYNFQTKKWEREGERMSFDKAYKRAYNLGQTNPFAQIGVVLLAGTKPGVNSRLNGSDSAKVDA